ncbi:small integral membrane protein 1 [Brachyhypopomus gauderio]|uniref:small integral membrane protein 1 n=1 Tax=Brachyhypopomus gauderio TaxID=698409 RepID=UPI00404289A7
MDSANANVQYNRWNEDVNLTVGDSQSSMNEFCNKLCTGQLGIAMRVAGSLAVMAAMYIIGYITGYYVHRC